VFSFQTCLLNKRLVENWLPINYQFSQQLVSESSCGFLLIKEEMQSLKFGIEKFNGRMNFGLWQIQVNDIQSGLHKALKGADLADCSKITNIVSLVIERDDDVL
jgi:hypothetical protein